MQNLGAQFIENIKNMAITFFCATAVINGDITFGVMISTQFILGMLNGPLVQFIGFIVSAQYATSVCWCHNNLARRQKFDCKKFDVPIRSTFAHGAYQY